MNTTELKKGIRARLSELAEQRKAIEAEAAALTTALGALGAKIPTGKQPGGHSGTQRQFRGRKPRAERERQMDEVIRENPARQFSPGDFEEFGIPGSTADAIMRGWVETGHVAQVGTTPRGAPIVQTRIGNPAGAPKAAEETPPADPAPSKRSTPSPAASKASAEKRKAEAEERRRAERMRIVNLLSNHPEGLMQREVAERIGVDQPRASLLLSGMEGSVAITDEKRKINGQNRPVKIVRLKGRGSGPREAVTAPGDGTREGRLR